MFFKLNSWLRLHICGAASHHSWFWIIKTLYEIKITWPLADVYYLLKEKVACVAAYSYLYIVIAPLFYIGGYDVSESLREMKLEVFTEDDL